MNATEILRKVDQIDGYYQSLKSREKVFQIEIDNLKKDIDVLIKSSSVLKHLLDSMVKEEVSKMSGLITYGLKTIFEDQNISFLPEITKKNDKISIELKTNSDGIEGDYESFGGSVAVIESFLLRVLYMLKKNHTKLLLLDESFSAVGEEYISNTGKLINELSKKLGIDILLVTHQKEFTNNANLVYRVDKTEEGLTIKGV